MNLDVIDEGVIYPGTLQMTQRERHKTPRRSGGELTWTDRR